MDRLFGGETPVALTARGARKIAAQKVGLTLEAYDQRVASGLKHCRACRTWKAIAEFNFDRSRHNGLASLCRLCQKGGPKQLRLIRPTSAEQQRYRYKTNADYRFRTRQRVHARRRGITPVPVDARDILTARFGGRCAYCQRPGTTWDHIVPVIGGGRTEPGNILPACASCNSRKRAMSVFDFIDRYQINPSDELLEAICFAVAWGQLEPPMVEHEHAANVD